MALFKVFQSMQTAQGVLNPDTVYDSANFPAAFYDDFIARGLATTSFDVDDANIIGQVTANANQISDQSKIRVNVKNLGLLPDTGADITSSLQSIINGNDKIFIGDGRYIISSPIILRSNLDILMSENCEIYLKNDSKCRMFDTDKNQTYTNITFKGGILNGNDNGQGVQSVTGFWDFTNALRLYNVKNLKITDILIKETRGHGIQHWNCDGFLFQNIEFDQGHDEVNRPDGGSRRDGITGGSSNGKYINIHGFTNDDMIAILSGVNWGGVYVNEVKNVEINGIKGDTKYFSAYSKTMKTWCAIRIACADGKYTKNIKVSDISGSFKVPPVRLGGYDIYRDGFLDNIQIKNIHDIDFVGEFDEQGLIYHEKGTCKNLTIDGVLIDGAGQYKASLIQNLNAKINTLNIRNVGFNYTISPIPSSGGVLIKDKWDDVTYASTGIDVINLYNVEFQDNNPNNILLYRKHISVTGVTVPLTTLKGSYISRKTYDMLSGDTTKIAVDSDFINTNYNLLLNQQTGYRVLSNNVVFVFLKGGFVPLAYKQSNVSNFYSFTPEENYLFVDVAGATQFYRIQDSVSYKFPIGYTLNIIRVDNNATYTPYIRMTNDVTLDGNVQTNVPIGAKMKIQYNGTNWRTV